MIDEASTDNARKRGRPRLGATASKPVTIYVTDTELARLKAYAANQQRSVSAAARRLVVQGIKGGD